MDVIEHLVPLFIKWLFGTIKYPGCLYSFDKGNGFHLKLSDQWNNKV